MRALALAFFIPCLAYAACPVETISDDASHSVRLSADQSGCSPHSIFTCEKGSLRISGTVKSLDSGSRQITVYCSLAKEEREAPDLMGLGEQQNKPAQDAELDEENPTN